MFLSVPYVTSKNNFENYDKLMIVAHPDDETLFGGKMLHDENGWFVACLTNVNTVGVDWMNPLYGQDYQDALDSGKLTRQKEFINAMNHSRTGYLMLGHRDGDFNNDIGGVKTVRENLRSIIDPRIKKWKKIVTHNAWGDYGHTQHVQTHGIVKDLASELNIVDGLHCFSFETNNPNNPNNGPLLNPPKMIEQLVRKFYPSQIELYEDVWQKDFFGPLQYAKWQQTIPAVKEKE